MEKKYYVVIICILIVTFCIYAYNYPPVKPGLDTTSVQFASLDESNNNSKPSMLRMSLIQEMVDNYRKTQLQFIERAPQNAVKADAHSILFDLDTLKKFISDIERGVKQVEPKNTPHLAIRMYYAAYPLQEKWNEPGYENLGKLLGKEIPKLYERKHTLILIPVIKNSNGVFADFNPFDKNTYQGFPKRMNRAMSLLSNEADTTSIPGLNHGQLIPPASIAGEGF